MVVNRLVALQALALVLVLATGAVCQDLCPEDDNKAFPGVCGCGIADVDSDGDGFHDCVDPCPQHPSRRCIYASNEEVSEPCSNGHAGTLMGLPTGDGIASDSILRTDPDSLKLGDNSDDLTYAIVATCPGTSLSEADVLLGAAFQLTCQTEVGDNPFTTTSWEGESSANAILDMDNMFSDDPRIQPQDLEAEAEVNDVGGTPVFDSATDILSVPIGTDGVEKLAATGDTNVQLRLKVDQFTNSNGRDEFVGCFGPGAESQDHHPAVVLTVHRATLCDAADPACGDLCPEDDSKIAPGECGCGVAEDVTTDDDLDGVPGCYDQCPEDGSKWIPGQCGCGVPDEDSDGDGVLDCLEACPADPNKQEPGACGCGNPDDDGDGDGFIFCNDPCPYDPTKQDPGICGCGVPDVDSDGDGLVDCLDECPEDPDKTKAGSCGCGVSDDADGDGVDDCTTCVDETAPGTVCSYVQPVDCGEGDLCLHSGTLSSLDGDNGLAADSVSQGTARGLTLGDTSSDLSLGFVVSFDVKLPETYLRDYDVITGAQLVLNCEADSDGTGMNPLTGSLWTVPAALEGVSVDLAPAFGSDSRLQPSDFEAEAVMTNVASAAEFPGTRSLTITLSPEAASEASKEGSHQFRVRMMEGSNGDATAQWVGCHGSNPNDMDKAPRLLLNVERVVCPGHGDASLDSDGDSLNDCEDECPLDPAKTAAGICGCGQADEGDMDGDGVLDCADDCPFDSERIEHPCGSDRARIVVLTDVGKVDHDDAKDHDDQQSLVRLLTYASDFEIEGLVATSSWHGPSVTDQTPGLFPDTLHYFIDAYAEVYEQLRLHVPYYPHPDALHAVVKTGNLAPVNFMRGDHMQFVGPGKSSEASTYIVSVLAKDDERPVWFLAWGKVLDLAQALVDMDEQVAAGTLSEQDAALMRNKIRVFDIAGQDNAGAFIARQYPDIFYIRSQSQFQGISYQGGDTSMFESGWTGPHLIENHGPLGAVYPPRHTSHAVVEGDTPSLLYLFPNGLGDPERQWLGTWGGRLTRLEVKNPTSRNQPDDAYRNFYMFGQAKDNGNIYDPVRRWRWDMQNDFAARMDWCIKTFEEANHRPTAYLNGDHGIRPVDVTASPGEIVAASAAGSWDVDGDNLSYSWWYYTDAGSCMNTASIDDDSAQDVQITVPAGCEPGSDLVFVLEVIDDGETPLKAYRTLVISVV